MYTRFKSFIYIYVFASVARILKTFKAFLELFFLLLLLFDLSPVCLVLGIRAIRVARAPKSALRSAPPYPFGLKLVLLFKCTPAVITPGDRSLAALTSLQAMSVSHLRCNEELSEQDIRAVPKELAERRFAWLSALDAASANAEEPEELEEADESDDNTHFPSRMATMYLLPPPEDFLTDEDFLMFDLSE